MVLGKVGNVEIAGKGYTGVSFSWITNLVLGNAVWKTFENHSI